jgi:glutamate-ammonia-ligase adenylyltransferase
VSGQRGKPDDSILARLDIDESLKIAVGAHALLSTRVSSFRDVPLPGQALRAMLEICQSGGVDLQPLTDADWRRIAHLLGFSTALTEHLVRHPTHLSSVTAAKHLPARHNFLEALSEAVTNKSWDAALDALRIEYRRQVAIIAALDLELVDGSQASLPQVCEALTDLAEAVVETALDLAKHNIAESQACRIAVMGMGKCGGRELNYVSDVDVLFVVEPDRGFDSEIAVRIGTQVARAVIEACSKTTSAGVIWELDPNLRPEGKSGALVRSLASYGDYYERWADTWEFQALLKARTIAGDFDLGREFVDAVEPLVWNAASRENFVPDVQAMRERVAQQLPAKHAETEIKLGRGGLRDVEFAVQLLQLVHGRTDVMIRSANTLGALEQLATWGYVGREDANKLATAYRFMRTLEHRIQMRRMTRTHIMPQDESEVDALGKSMGFASDSVQGLIKQWKLHSVSVRSIHEKLFYRPLLAAISQMDSADARLSTEGVKRRLEVLGYKEPEYAVMHIKALTTGVTRRAIMQRTLLPALLEWFAQGPDPDHGLLAFRRVSEGLGSTPWFLRLLRDGSAAAQRLATILSTSRFTTDLLLRTPDAVMLLSDDEGLAPRGVNELAIQSEAILGRYDEPREVIRALRAMRRLELFRISAADVLGLIDLSQVSAALSDLADVVVTTSFRAIARTFTDAPEMLVVSMGRYGGKELAYGSDLDVMVFYVSSGAKEQDANVAQAIVTQLRTLLTEPTADPAIILDFDLRPEGKQGPLVRSFESLEAYYERWYSHWETQALLRARVVMGSPWVQESFSRVIDPLRYRDSGLSETQLLEVRRLKARMESERLPQGADPKLHTKLGPGGLSDVEWLIQLIQIQHSHEFPQLQTPRTRMALEVAIAEGLLSAEQGKILLESWDFVSRLRNAIVLGTGRASDMLPTDSQALAVVSQLMGFGMHGGQEVLEQYQRLTRRTRRIFLDHFYGSDGA